MPMDSLLSDPVVLVSILLLGMLAGTLGGMLGVGGSIVMIPGLAILFSLGRTPEPNQHLFQASAMIVNVVVSVPAALRHRKADALVPEALLWMLPAALASVLLGVWISNLPVFSGVDGGRWLGKLMAAFMVYVIVMNILKLRTRKDSATSSRPRVTPFRATSVGLTMGTVAGLLGIGGGSVAVALQQALLKLPLRQCIANSSAVICISAAVGAIYKNATLAQHATEASPIDWRASLLIALLLTPTAWVGSRIGSGLTHSLPIRQVRIAFICLMVVAAWKMSGLPFGLPGG